MNTLNTQCITSQPDGQDCCQEEDGEDYPQGYAMDRAREKFFCRICPFSEVISQRKSLLSRDSGESDLKIKRGQRVLKRGVRGY